MCVWDSGFEDIWVFGTVCKHNLCHAKLYAWVLFWSQNINEMFKFLIKNFGAKYFREMFKFSNIIFKINSGNCDFLKRKTAPSYALFFLQKISLLQNIKSITF